MTYRLALASSDGKMVNKHFGHADCFYVVEIRDNNYYFVESRNVQPCCNYGKHKTDSFDAILKVLYDVQVIIVSRIGEGAAEYLESKGILVYEAPYPIIPLLEKIIKDRLFEVDKWELNMKN